MDQKKKVRVLTGVVVALSFLVLVLAGFALMLAFGTPLAKPMVITTQEVRSEPAAAAAPTVVEAKANPQKKDGLCGKSGSQIVMFNGADFSLGVEPLGADAVRYVKLDYDNGKITVVAFPRDLWVKTAGLTSQNIAETRLGMSYYYKKEATKGSDKHRITVATELLAQVIYDNFEVVPVNYLTLQLDNIAEMIETIGGVEVNIPTTIISDAKVTFPAGLQTLDGPLSAEYLRTYLPGGEPARLQRQNLYLRALQKKVMNANIVSKTPDLIKQYDKSIVTDLSPKELLALACMSEAVPQKEIVFHEIGGDLVTEGENMILFPKVDEIKTKLREWLDL
jgi:LCP family protein required for cell wall assembly